MHTGKCLTGKDNDMEEGDEVVQKEFDKLDSQKWIFKDSKINGWVISSYTNPELSISIEGEIQNGSKIILSKTVNNDNQMFYMYNITQEEKTKENGLYRFAVGIDSEKVIEVTKDDMEKIDIYNYRKCFKSKI